MSETFEDFPKIARLSRECVVTEKIDGTNAAINFLTGAETPLDGKAVAHWGDVIVHVQSRTRNITPGDDNFGFATWVGKNAEALFEVLGYGRHFGEWWGSGIQRGYGLQEKRFSLFNTHRWATLENDLVSCVPILYEGLFDTAVIQSTLTLLGAEGSRAAPGFMKPEGVVVFHKAANTMFKKTLDKDDEYKGKQQ